MKNYFVYTTIYIFIMTLTILSNAQAAPSPKMVIYNVTLISPNLSAPVKNSYIIIENGKIIKVGKGKPKQIKQNETFIDGAGRFLIPGLMDAHVHLAGIPGFDFFQPNDKMPDVVNAYRTQLPKSYLYFGFTTLVDLAVIDPKPINQFKAAPLHPDLYDCGGALAMANGYPMAYAPKSKRFNMFPNFIYDPQQKNEIPNHFKPENHSPEAAVKRVKDSGGRCVKTFYEKGFGDKKNLPVVNLEQITEIITQSHRYKLPVLMHANSNKAHQFAVTAGVDIIAHGMWNWRGIKLEKELPRSIRETLDQMISKNIGYMPTMRVLAGIQSLYDPKFLDDPQLKHVLPVSLINWYQTEEGKWFAETIKKEEGMETLEDSKIYSEFKTPLKRGNQVAQYLAAHHGKLLFGSDTPSSPTYGNPPGYNGYLELKHLAEAGIPLKKILEATTINNAKAFHLEQQYGTIEPGKVANLLLLTQNPLKTVEAYDSIEIVILNGEYVKRETLSALYSK